MRLCTASIALFHLGAGDYRVFIVDFPKELIMGEDFVPICKPSMRRLISYQPKALLNYNERGESIFKQYRIEEKLEKIESSWKTLS